MLKENELVGALIALSPGSTPFTDKQIDLVKNFAAQAVIAIENARLLNELRQSLDQQTATADVLQVISSSRGDLEPVFATVLDNATRLCGAKFGNLCLREARLFVCCAARVATEFRRGAARYRRVRPGSDVLLASDETKRPVQIPDIRSEQGYREGKPWLSWGRDSRLVASAACRCSRRTTWSAPSPSTVREVRPFTDKQIELFRTSLHKPLSPSRTRGCSTNSANAPSISATAPPTLRKRWSSKQPRRMCLRSSVGRRSTFKRSSRQLPRVQSGYAAPTGLSFFASMESCCEW